MKIDAVVTLTTGEDGDGGKSQIKCVCACVGEVVTWLQGPGSELLKTQRAIGDSMRAAQALQQKHEEIESQHSVRRAARRPLASVLEPRA